MKVAILTLGCDKNTVDSERYLAELVDRGAEVAPNAEDADIILVNTCGFIDAAKKESIDAIVEAGRLKESGRAQAVVAVGCMVERHKSELEDALPEVDLFLGASEMDRLVPELIERGFIDSAPAVHPGLRLFSGELPHVRYLKVSEGCDHGCAFCAIPLMRGKHRSFSLGDVVREAQLLEAQGAREVNLVAQDLAHWGRDFRVAGGAPTGERLPTLLEALLRETSIPWIRMLYLYNAGITPTLLELVAREPRLLPYFDMPIQHGADEVLKRMRRPERNRTIREKVERIREAVPDVAIRTTCIVGFPGETDADFATLLQLLEDVQFDRVGAFTYSPQEGTAANELADDVPESLKQERLERLNELQRLITAERFEQRVGRTVAAIVDRVHDEDTIEARTIWQAHDIDGITLCRTQGAGYHARAGSLMDVRVDEVADDVDLRATIARVQSHSTPPRAMRSLPLASIGSWGK
ncbi:MAG TPA: 30S ribosomal protein S12 methylthiotransferase RimO [Gemmatimonadaceae bacterium]|nr:30S ribosomal protein S12 methylthiotransferase RimO [Gemmatimonadaceae bacterium]